MRVPGRGSNWGRSSWSWRWKWAERPVAGGKVRFWVAELGADGKISGEEVDGER
ncbi:hypothetical protein ABZT04_03820 [Streptomyces sp. NPDC005492]|uniref:hypothetical protein n=1 Tax=Streptomyces sp. NPDC005492 TaxID=3156883 RepID=UPI0033ACA28C